METQIPTLVVLAGGESSRMGRAKSEIGIGGELMLERILHRLNWTGQTMLVLASLDRKPEGSQLFDRIIVDLVPGSGPLMGIYSALGQISTSRAIFVPVDMPMITREQIDIICRTDAIGVLCKRIVNGEEIIEPFPSIFKQEAMTPIKQMLDAKKRSLHGLLSDSQFQTLDATSWPEQTWTNLNTPEDLAAYEKAFVNQ